MATDSDDVLESLGVSAACDEKEIKATEATNIAVYIISVNWLAGFVSASTMAKAFQKPVHVQGLKLAQPTGVRPSSGAATD